MSSEVVTHEQLETFVMPKVHPGTSVAWYATGKRGSVPQIGFVIRCMPRSIHVLTATSGVKETVRHIDDPKLQLNVEQRETGAWDFTDDDKNRTQMMAEMDDRIRALERSVASLTLASARAEINGDDYEALKKKVADLGVVFKGNPARKWLEEQINKASE